MRKQTKLVAVLSAAALLAMGASMTSFAAWEEQDGTWVWLNSQGERATETWKKSGNQYFWLDENGEMATETLVEDDDDTYYVDANGARVVNQWVAVDNDDLCEEEVDVIYFYFGTTGKATKPSGGNSHKITTITGKKYIFDADGHMLSGWQEIDGNIYYLGEENEGWAYTGWNFLELSENAADSGNDYDDEEWFYFASSGKAHKKARKYVEGAYYAFDDYGVMDDEWVTGTPWSAATVANVASQAVANKSFYKEEVGNQVIGWNYYYDNNDEDGDKSWFYLVGSNTGVPFNYNAAAALNTSNPTTPSLDAKKYVAAQYEQSNGTDKLYNGLAAKVIKGKTYLFDANGKMLTGVYEVPTSKTIYRESGTGNLGAGIYYFNKTSGSSEGQMMTGKQTINYDGDTYYYYFKKSGEAYTDTIADGSLYNSKGVRVNAEDGNSYAVINLPSGGVEIKGVGTGAPGSSTNKLTGRAIVSANGKIKKSGKVTIDGMEYTVTNYIVTASVPK